MIQDKCPCEECISLAICYQNNHIKCELLYKFVCHINNTSYLGFTGYVEGAGNSVYKVFNRYIYNTNFPVFEVSLTNCKRLAMKDLYDEYKLPM